jgi:DNA primase
MKPEDDQELWDLLGRMPGREVSPFFARNVLRQIHEAAEASRFEQVPRWISLRRLMPATALAVAVIVSIIAVHHPESQRPSQNEPDVVAKIDPQDFEVVADLDDLLASDEGSLWDEKPTL